MPHPALCLLLDPNRKGFAPVLVSINTLASTGGDIGYKNKPITIFPFFHGDPTSFFEIGP